MESGTTPIGTLIFFALLVLLGILLVVQKKYVVLGWVLIAVFGIAFISNIGYTG